MVAPMLFTMRACIYIKAFAMAAVKTASQQHGCTRITRLVYLNLPSLDFLLKVFFSHKSHDLRYNLKHTAFDSVFHTM